MTRIIAFLVAALASTTPALAQWPERPVKVIVPYGAGGASDTMARTFAEVLSTAFGKQFVIENRPGGGSVTGSREAARSAPDGYTLALTGMSTHVLAPAMNKNAGFDPVRDFTHIAYFGGAPNLFVVHPSFGSTNFRDFMRRAKAGEQIDYVSPGVGSVGNLVAEYLAAKEQLKLQHIPYKGGAEALLDLVAGHVKVGMMSISTAREQVRAGKLVAIGISSPQRLADMPEVPTLAELGYPDLTATTWWALSAPAGLPPAIVAAVNRAINAGLSSPAVQKQLAQDGAEARAMSPAELSEFMRAEVEKWAPIAGRVGGG